MTSKLNVSPMTRGASINFGGNWPVRPASTSLRSMRITRWSATQEFLCWRPTAIYNGCRSTRSAGAKIGRELLDMVQVAKRRDATSMMLEVRSTNENAIGMYEGLGFHAIATRSRYYPDGGDAVIMRLRPLEVSP